MAMQAATAPSIIPISPVISNKDAVTVRLQEHVRSSFEKTDFLSAVKDTSFNAHTTNASVDSIVKGLKNYENPEKLWDSIMQIVTLNAKEIDCVTMNERPSEFAGVQRPTGINEFFTIAVPGELLRKGHLRALADFGIFAELSSREPVFITQKLQECLPNLSDHVVDFYTSAFNLASRPNLDVRVIDIDPLGAPGRGRIGAMKIFLMLTLKESGSNTGLDQQQIGDLLVKRLTMPGEEDQESIGAKKTIATQIERIATQILKKIEPETYGHVQLLSCENDIYFLMSIHSDENGHELPTYFDLMHKDPKISRLFTPLKTKKLQDLEDIMHSLSKEEIEKLFQGFGKSLAYDYFLGIRDRHENNVLLTKDLTPIHIDFGLSLGGMREDVSLWQTWAIYNQRSKAYLNTLKTLLIARQKEQGSQIDKVGLNNSLKEAEDSLFASVKTGFDEAALKIHEKIRLEIAQQDENGILNILDNPPSILMNELTQKINDDDFAAIQKNLVEFGSVENAEDAIANHWKIVSKDHTKSAARLRDYQRTREERGQYDYD